MFTLRKAIRICEQGEAWTVATNEGEGWLYYYDGHDLRCGAPIGVTLEDLLDRACVEIYRREGIKRLSKISLKSGLAFVVVGDEDGTI